MALASPKGPAATFHFTQAANGVKDDGGPVDGQLRLVQI